MQQPSHAETFRMWYPLAYVDGSCDNGVICPLACGIHSHVDGSCDNGICPLACGIHSHMWMVAVIMGYIHLHSHADGNCDNGIICPLACGIHSHMWMVAVIMGYIHLHSYVDGSCDSGLYSYVDGSCDSGLYMSTACGIQSLGYIVASSQQLCIPIRRCLFTCMWMALDIYTCPLAHGIL